MAVSDTGCQSTVVLPKFAYALGYRRKDFIPVVSRIKEAGKDSDLGMMGAAVIEFKSEGRSTKKLCYVFDQVTEVFLSRQGLVDLQCIPANFPQQHQMNSAYNS